VEGAAAKEDVGMNMICPDTPMAATINDATVGARTRQGEEVIATKIVMLRTKLYQTTCLQNSSIGVVFM
jgi:hypothetical protein